MVRSITLNRFLGRHWPNEILRIIYDIKLRDNYHRKTMFHGLADASTTVISLNRQLLRDLSSNEFLVTPWQYGKHGLRQIESYLHHATRSYLHRTSYPQICGPGLCSEVKRARLASVNGWENCNKFPKSLIS